MNLTPYGAVKITVSDPDRFIAAAIANEILSQVDNLNKQKVVENRKYVIREYEFLLKEFSSDVNSQRDSIKKLLESFSQFAKENKVSYEKTESTLNSLSNASREYEKLSGDWLTLRKVHLLSLKEIEKFNLPNFVIVQYALPETLEPVLSPSHVAFVFLVFIFGLWASIVVLLLYFKYSNDLKFILNNSVSRNGHKSEAGIEVLDPALLKANGHKAEIEKIKN